MFKELEGIVKETKKLKLLQEIEEATKEYSQVSDSEKEDIRDWLVDLVASDCEHDVVDQDSEQAVCEICHASTYMFVEPDEDGLMIEHYGEWTTHKTSLERETTSLLSIKAMDIVKGQL